MSKKTRKMYEEHLNNMGIPDYELKSIGGRIPDHVKYGSWLRRNDFLNFELGYHIFSR
jgi:hypothetical protein